MSERFSFPITRVRRAKQRAAAAARIDRGVEPVGRTLDPTAVLASFGCLHVKPGWKLLAYLQGDHLGAESRVVAVPADFDPAGAVLLPVPDPPRADDVPYDHVLVRIHTSRLPRANPEGVWLHEDRYAMGSHDPDLERILEAPGRPARVNY